MRWVIMTLHNVVSFVTISDVSLFIVPLTLYFVIHLHKLVTWVSRCLLITILRFI